MREPPLIMYYIGDLDPETEQQIQILKCATLLRELLSETGQLYKITFSALTYQIGKLNAATATARKAAFPENVRLRRTVSFETI